MFKIFGNKKHLAKFGDIFEQNWRNFDFVHPATLTTTKRTVVEWMPSQSRDGFELEFCESSQVRVLEMQAEPSRVGYCELRAESS